MTSQGKPKASPKTKSHGQSHSQRKGQGHGQGKNKFKGKGRAPTRLSPVPTSRVFPPRPLERAAPDAGITLDPLVAPNPSCSLAAPLDVTPECPFQPEPPMHPVCVGRILGPHGIQGALRVRSYTQEPETLFGLSPVFLEGSAQPFTFKHTLKEKGDGIFVVTARGVSSRTQADSLKGVCLMVDRTTLSPLDQGIFYHQDLVGLNVVSPPPSMGSKVADTVVWGVVKSVQNFGAGDLLEVHLPQEPSESWFIPFKDPWVREVCPQNRSGDGESDGYIAVDREVCVASGFWNAGGDNQS